MEVICHVSLSQHCSTHHSVFPCDDLQVYLDQPGWTVRQDLSTFQHDNYGHLVPEVKRAVMRVKEQAGVDLDCARAMAAAGIDDAEMVSTLMAGTEHTAYPSPARG